MKRIFPLLLSGIFLFCQSAVAQGLNDSNKTYHAHFTAGKDHYDLKLHFYTTNDDDELKKNSVFTISRINPSPHTIYIDSLFCKEFFMDSVDFTNDGIKDLLLIENAGARANVYYHLFIIWGDHVNKIKGFEKLPNPQADSDIIYSTGLYGMRMGHSLYRIKNFQLIDLHKKIDVDFGDSTQLDQAINEVRHKKKK
jgi:hypothetical protein